MTMFRGRSSDGRALAQHARGTGIDTQRLHELLLNAQISYDNWHVSFLVQATSNPRCNGFRDCLSTRKSQLRIQQVCACGSSCLFTRTKFAFYRGLVGNPFNQRRAVGGQGRNSRQTRCRLGYDFPANAVNPFPCGMEVRTQPDIRPGGPDQFSCIENFQCPSLGWQVYHSCKLSIGHYRNELGFIQTLKAIDFFDHRFWN